MAVGVTGIAVAAILMLALAAVTGVVILFVVLALGRSSREPDQSQPTTPLEILEARYARGEIDSADYEERRARILAAHNSVNLEHSEHLAR